MLYACDLAWWQRHHAEVAQRFAGEKWTQNEAAAASYGLHHIPSAKRRGLSLDPRLIHQGGNSGYQAINLAVLWGASRIVLLGYDMQRTGGKSHWFGDHPPGLQLPSPFARWLDDYQTLADDAGPAGVEIINASRDTALICFPRMPLEALL